MSKKNRKNVTETKVEGTQVEANGATQVEEVVETGTHIGPFATEAEATPFKPTEGKNWRLIEVSKKSKVIGFTYARDHNGAVSQIARKQDGYSAKLVTKVLAPEKVGSLLDQMS